MAGDDGIRDRLLAVLLPQAAAAAAVANDVQHAAGTATLGQQWPPGRGAAAQGPAADPLPLGVARRYGLMEWPEALRALHAPASTAEWAAARRRFAFQVRSWHACLAPNRV